MLGAAARERLRHALRVHSCPPAGGFPHRVACSAALLALPSPRVRLNLYEPAGAPPAQRPFPRPPPLRLQTSAAQRSVEHVRGARHLCGAAGARSGAVLCAVRGAGDADQGAHQDARRRRSVGHLPARTHAPHSAAAACATPTPALCTIRATVLPPRACSSLPLHPVSPSPPFAQRCTARRPACCRRPPPRACRSSAWMALTQSRSGRSSA